MRQKNRAAIVNLSSASALAGLEVVPHYSAAKGAATALFLASDDSSFFTGQWLSFTGGLLTG